MVKAVRKWNECAEKIYELRRQAGDKNSSINHGELPLLPAEMSTNLIEEPVITAYGLKPA
jgi:hypothetical protein